MESFTNKKYLILLQNNYEIRASGGFMGSYAILNFGDIGLDDWSVQNIYVPDGQLKGHVSPIIPIQQAFKTGDWKLRDSNWKIDYREAAKDIEWFFEKGGENDIDGIIALNFSLIEKWVDILGGLYIQDFKKTVDSKNLYSLTQMYSEQKSFSGSTQKQTFLNSLGSTLVNKMQQANIFTTAKIAKLIYKELENGQIIVWIKDNNLAQKISRLGWDGSLGKYEFDFLYPVESNLGANKANCCITRSIVHTVITDQHKSLSKVEINLQNTSQASSPIPPTFWGGDYINYERIVIPSGAKNISVNVNGTKYSEYDRKDVLNLPEVKKDFTFSTETFGNFKVVGFWLLVPAKSIDTATLSYTLTLKPNQKYYAVKIKTQPGISELDYSLILNGRLASRKKFAGEKIIVKNI